MISLLMAASLMASASPAVDICCRVEWGFSKDQVLKAWPGSVETPVTVLSEVVLSPLTIQNVEIDGRVWSSVTFDFRDDKLDGVGLDAYDSFADVRRSLELKFGKPVIENCNGTEICRYVAVWVDRKRDLLVEVRSPDDPDRSGKSQVTVWYSRLSTCDGCYGYGGVK